MAKEYLARFTPVSIKSTPMKNHSVRISARGIIENRNGSKKRTVTAFDNSEGTYWGKLAVGCQAILRGTYERVKNADGNLGGEYFKATALLKVCGAPVPPQAANENLPNERPRSGREVAPHERTGHWRWQACGKGRQELRRVWVRKTQVGRKRIGQWPAN